MALICCCSHDETCICEKVQPCGGVHIFTKDCPQHILKNRDDQPAPYTSTIHETGKRNKETIRTELA